MIAQAAIRKSEIVNVRGALATRAAAATNPVLFDATRLPGNAELLNPPALCRAFVPHLFDSFLGQLFYAHICIARVLARPD